MTQQHHVATSLQSIFKEFYRHHILSNAIVDDLIIIADICNEISHMYDKAAAERIRQEILQHAKVFDAVIKSIAHEATKAFDNHYK